MDARTFRRSTIVATWLAAIACIVGVVLWNAPANWLAAYVASRTGGVVLLADADGTVWSGSAVLALGAPGGQTGVPDGGPATGSVATRLALPGRIIWKLEFEPGLAPVLHLTHDGVLQQPVTVRRAGAGLAVDAGTAVVPASMLELVGAPLNTLRPEGRCTLAWQATTLGAGGDAIGSGTLRIAGFGLAISPVRPLGDYLVNWASNAEGLTWQLATEQGPLDLTGNGRLAGSRSQARVVVRAATTAAPGVVALLAPLLDMIGRRGANEAVIETGRSS